MASMTIGPQDLLVYDARYRVLICRECQYAIQKSALQSHLLRHKIYREERQRLLFSISQLDLCEPHDVSLPAPTSPPIQHLTLLAGYRCLVDACNNLCSSTKRMRQHQSKEHGFSDSFDFGSSTRSIQLQTFFRGNKIRYFEVAGSPAVDTATDPLSDSLGGNDGTRPFPEKQFDERMHSPEEIPPSPQHVSESGGAIPSLFVENIDLEILTYFHHFTTITSLTLPWADTTNAAFSCWQTQVVPQALQQRWLMCGLLAVSACHKAALANDFTCKKIHRERSTPFSLEFSATWEQRAPHDHSRNTMTWEQEVEAAAGLTQCILRCAHWMFTEDKIDQNESRGQSAQLQLHTLLANIRSFIVPESKIVFNRLQGGDGREDAFKLAAGILNSTTTDNSLSIPLNRLASLPSGIAEALGRPDNVADVLATMNAIAALVNCCAIGFRSEDVGVMFLSMAMWLVEISDRFQSLIDHCNPAALVVLAHWAAYLVARAENYGCWFLRHSAKIILRCIREQLANNSLVLKMIENIE